jgi:predicted dehydrogenase
VRIAVIGCGSAGSRHAQNLVDMGHALILFDQDPSISEELKARLSSRSGTRSIQSVSTADEIFGAGVDACIVASPTDTHSEYAISVISQGIPVFVEKPLAVSYRQGLTVAEAASAGALLMIGYNLRFFRPVCEIQKAIVRGDIGRPLAASFRFGYDLRLWRPRIDYRKTYSGDRNRGGGILLEASHEIDLACWLFGPIRSAFGVVRRTKVLEADVDDVTASVLETSSGVVVSLFLDMISPTYRRGLEVVGEKGSLGWQWVDSSEARADLDESYRAELSYFLGCVEAGEKPEPNAQDALHVLAVAEAIASASDTKKAAKIRSLGDDSDGNQP